MRRTQKKSFIVNSISLVILFMVVFIIPVHSIEIPKQAVDVSTKKHPKKSVDIVTKNIIVTVRKRSETLHDVPVAVTAFNEDQLDRLKIRDFNDLSDGMANVMLEDIGTARGTANFSIRGLGINSSIPSIDPTVGVFVDGIYIGTNSGIITDMFDIESIQVLRGPQGILFGRNVTGGAILIQTKIPENLFGFKGKTSITGGGDGGQNKTSQASFNIPLNDNLFTKLSFYYNNDEGYLENLFDGSNQGAIEQIMFRSTTLWESADDLNITFKYEYMDIKGDGPASQNHVNGSGIGPELAFEGTSLAADAVTFDRNALDFSIDEPGFQDTMSKMILLNVDWEVAGGNLTYILGYRYYASDTLADIDGQPFFLFNSDTWLRSKQLSNELRFNRKLKNGAHIIFGVYQYSNNLKYHERRQLPLTPILQDRNEDGELELLALGIYQDGGGLHDTNSRSMFASIDFQITDQLTGLIGGRYTRERKGAQIASLNLNITSFRAGDVLPQGPACNSVINNDCVFDFTDDKQWSSFAPKLGLTYTRDNDDLVYGHWSKGFRSGGYNLRNSADTSTPDLLLLNGPGPFDQEEVNSFEVGYKHSAPWGQINGALFYTVIDDMQREVNTSADVTVIVQVIKNTAKATMMGLEVDGTFKIFDNLVATFNLGLIDANYNNINFDISGDGVINNIDFDLNIPRVPEITYSVGLSQDVDLAGSSYLVSRISYSFRDKTYYTDNNLGFIDEQRKLNIGFDFYPDENWIVSIFGKNLLNEIKHGNDTQLPFGTFSPLAKGRIIGAEVTYTY